MANQEYREITPELLERVKGNAWSIESMEQGEGGRAVNYLGSTRQGAIIRDYYVDAEGKYWYRNRAIVDGHIVSMEVYLFGKETSAIKRRRG